MRVLLITLIFSVLYVTPSTAQTMAVYSDYRDYFYVFDDGLSRELEYLPVRSYKVGGNTIAYLDDMGNFIVYYKGRKITMEKYEIRNYFVTRNMVIYTLESQLIVFDNGRRKTLMYYPAYYAFGDSIVAFYDKSSNYLKVYYNGEISEIEDALAGSPVKSMLVGDNIIAYKDHADYFKIFYRNKLYDQAYNISSFSVGRNTVAYVEEATSEFKAFYKGDTYNLETFPPRSFKVGDDMVAYIDESGSFKVFSGERTYEISSFEPEFYKVVDNMLVYSEDNFLKVFTDGESYTLENYIPSQYYIAENVVAFIDRDEHLIGFYGGKLLTLSYEDIDNIEVSGNTVSFTVGVHTNKIFYKGHIYTM